MFRALGNLVTQYNKLFGSGGTKAIRQQLGLSDYNSKVKTTKALEKAASKLSSTEKKAKLQLKKYPYETYPPHKMFKIQLIQQIKLKHLYKTH